MNNTLCDKDTRCQPEVVITVAFLDEHGDEQYTTIRTTIAADIIQGRSGMIRQTLERHCTLLGYEILSVQARYETHHPVVTLGSKRPQLRLAYSRKLGVSLLLAGAYLLGEFSSQEPLLAAESTPTTSAGHGR